MDSVGRYVSVWCISTMMHLIQIKVRANILAKSSKRPFTFYQISLI